MEAMSGWWALVGGVLMALGSSLNRSGAEHLFEILGANPGTVFDFCTQFAARHRRRLLIRSRFCGGWPSPPSVVVPPNVAVLFAVSPPLCVAATYSCGRG